MKKNFVCAVLYFTLFSALSADITSNLNTYLSFDCTFEERNASHKKDGHSRTHPHMPTKKGTSLNWSGYASATNIHNPTPDSVSTVNGTWTVPKLKATNNNSYAAIWVGIDGYSSATVEQLGTEHDWINGVQQNYAWFEMYPFPSYQITGFPVDIGDVIQAEVEYQGHNTFQLSIVNHTKSLYTVIPSNLTMSAVAKRSSAEWIVEAPYSSEVLPLADFQEAAFTNCTATINGATGGIAHSGWQADAITMESTQGVAKAVPSSLTDNNESFTVTWKHE
jgi:hypothetical protein